jgi:hypothetical protein
MHKSTDGGMTWSAFNTGLTTQEPPGAAKRSRQGYHAAQTEPNVGHG